MNYLKRIKILGFKKIDPIIVYQDNGSYSIEKLSDYIKNCNNNGKVINFLYPRVNEEQYNRITSYLYKLSESISIYLILVGEIYTVVVKDNTAKKKIYLPVLQGRLDSNFWKYILSCLEKNIQREILIKDILK